MDNYSFTPIVVVIHWYIRLRSWFVAHHDNRALYKQFTMDQHLDKLKKENISYNLPKSYPIVTNEITRYYHIRDRILMKIHHDEYASKQIAIDNRLKELESEHALLKDRRRIEKDYLDKLRSKKRQTKDSLNYIALESRISKAISTLNNTDHAIKNCENQVSNLIHTKKDNLTTWNKQIAITEKTIEMAIGLYIKRATKKIELVYGFTEFAHEVAGYDAEMQKTIKGEY